MQLKKSNLLGSILITQTHYTNSYQYQVQNDQSLNLILSNLQERRTLANHFLSKTTKSRVKRANNELFEEWRAPDLERECVVEKCDFEELYEVYKMKDSLTRQQQQQSAKLQWKLFTNLCVYGQKEDRCHEVNTKVCKNKWRSLVCECHEGWTGKHCRENINECQDPRVVHECKRIDPNMKCEDTPGSHRCICDIGYSEKNYAHKTARYCENINECQSDSTCDQTCQDTPGSYKCGCHDGYVLADDKKTCLDINECEEYGFMINHCDLEISTCVNHPGDYGCTCNPGYTHIDKEDVDPLFRKFCDDIDECDLDNVCSDNNNIGSTKQCINYPGSYKCECNAGFENLNNDQKNDCVDIDECLIENGHCSQICTNLPGTRECSCREGYYLDKFDKASCYDVDEWGGVWFFGSDNYFFSCLPT